MISAGTRESEQPRMIANGFCATATSRRRDAPACASVLRTSATNRRLPSRRRCRAWSAESIIHLAVKVANYALSAAVAYPRPMTPVATKYAERFRGFLPVVVDIETGGFDSEK